METWNKYFEGKNQEKIEQVNEHHKKGKEEQHKFICEVLDKMGAKEIKQVYDFIESMDFYKNNYEK